MQRAFKIALLLATPLARADPAFFCKSTKDSSKTISGDLNVYERCDTSCDCTFYELLCLKLIAEKTFQVQSLSYAEAQACKDSKQCVCNDEGNRWTQTSSKANNGEALPARLLVPMPASSVLVAAAESSAAEDAYYGSLWTEFKGI